MKMTKPDLPDAMTAQALEAAALGLRMFIDLGRLTLKTEKPEAYAKAGKSIADGSAVVFYFRRGP